MAKVAKIWDGTAWVDLATSVPNLSNYQLKSEGGLTLVKKQTIGTAVASVTVTDAFSATYECYKIIISGGVGNATNVLTLRLGATATGYYTQNVSGNFAGSAPASTVTANAAQFASVGSTDTTQINAEITLFGLFLTKKTLINNPLVVASPTGYVLTQHGFLDNAISYTDFTITTPGTLTGGTIYVYGYNKG